MGCDIHAFAEVRRNGQWEPSGAVFPEDEFGREYHKRTHTEEPFGWRSYGMFGFLANVRNYSFVPPLAEPLHTLPDDVSERVASEYERWEGEAHSTSYLTLRQLVDFDYDQTFEDRRCIKQIAPNAWDGSADAGEGNGEKTTFRDFLGKRFFEHLDVLKSLGTPNDVRIVFWFDN